MDVLLFLSRISFNFAYGMKCNLVSGYVCEIHLYVLTVFSCEFKFRCISFISSTPNNLKYVAQWIKIKSRPNT